MSEFYKVVHVAVRAVGQLESQLLQLVNKLVIFLHFINVVALLALEIFLSHFQTLIDSVDLMGPEEEVGALPNEFFELKALLELSVLADGLNVVNHGQASSEVDFLEVVLADLVGELVDAVELLLAVLSVLFRLIVVHLYCNVQF